MNKSQVHISANSGLMQDVWEKKKVFFVENEDVVI